MTNQELADKIIREEPTATTSRHDEHTYDGKWGEPIVGYWTLGACEVFGIAWRMIENTKFA